MRPPGPGVWVTGPSRSGTSMVAGLFAEHGVFFGRTVEGDEHNEHGYFEHPELVSRVESRIWADWPEAWWRTLEGEGFERGGYWGVKRGRDAWPWIRELGPELIVVCRRPVDETVRSRRRRWPRKRAPRGEVLLARKAFDKIGAQAGICPMLTVNTERVVAGDYRRIATVFKRLGLRFDPAIAREWIDPGIWNRGSTQ